MTQPSTGVTGSTGTGVSEKMQAALQVSKLKFNAFSGAANESLGKFSESVANKSQLIKEDIMEEYERMRLQTLPDRNDIFGVPIEQTIIVKGQGWTRTIPAIVEETIRYIIENKGYLEEGIFRLSGRISEITALKEEYNRMNGGVHISKFTEDVHSATGLLKLYLRELPETLFTNAMMPQYDEVLAPEYIGNREKDMLALIKLIPQVCRNTLHEIFDLLRVVAEHESTNKMGIKNLSIIFVSTLAIDYELFNYVFNNQDILFYSETVTGAFFPKKNNCKQCNILTESGKLSKSLPIPKSKSSSCDQLLSPKTLPEKSPRPMPNPLTLSSPVPSNSTHLPPSQPPPSYPSSQPPMYPPNNFLSSPPMQSQSPTSPPVHIHVPVVRGQPGSHNQPLHSNSTAQSCTSVPVRGLPSVSSQPNEQQQPQESNFDRMRKKLEENLASSHGATVTNYSRGQPEIQPELHYLQPVPPSQPSPNSLRGLPQPQLTSALNSNSGPPNSNHYSHSNPFTQSNPSNSSNSSNQNNQNYQNNQNNPPLTHQISLSSPPQQPSRNPNARPVPAPTGQPLKIQILSNTTQPVQPTQPTQPNQPTHASSESVRENVTTFGSIQNNPFMQQQQQNSSQVSPVSPHKKTTRRADPHNNLAQPNEGMPF